MDQGSFWSWLPSSAIRPTWNRFVDTCLSCVFGILQIRWRKGGLSDSFPCWQYRPWLRNHPSCPDRQSINQRWTTHLSLRPELWRILYHYVFVLIVSDNGQGLYNFSFNMSFSPIAPNLYIRHISRVVYLPWWTTPMLCIVPCTHVSCRRTNSTTRSILKMSPMSVVSMNICGTTRSSFLMVGHSPPADSYN